VLAQGTTGTDLSITQPVVDITWMVEPSLTSNINLNLMPMWSAGLQVNGFSADSAYVSHFINGAWNTNATSSATIGANGMYQLQLSGVTSFSPFAVFGAHTVATAITELPGSNITFEIYPNPASDILIVKNTSGAVNTMYVDLLDMNGRVIARYQIDDLTTNISLLNLSAGNYLLKLYNDNTSEVKRFVKL
jgi:hypothetical protein